MRENLHYVALLKGLGDMIYARKTFIVQSKWVSFLSGTMQGCLAPPLIFVNKKGLTKLELKVHVIQSLIKPPLLILH